MRVGPKVEVPLGLSTGRFHPRQSSTPAFDLQQSSAGLPSSTLGWHGSEVGRKGQMHALL